MGLQVLRALTDGNWTRLLLCSLMKVIRRRKSGGGAWDPVPLGQESYGSSAVEDGPSNNHDLSWNLSFGTSQIPRLEVRGIWGAFPSHWLICPKGLPLAPSWSVAPNPPGQNQLASCPPNLPPPAVGSQTLTACRTTFQLPCPVSHYPSQEYVHLVQRQKESSLRMQVQALESLTE